MRGAEGRDLVFFHPQDPRAQGLDPGVEGQLAPGDPVPEKIEGRRSIEGTERLNAPSVAGHHGVKALPGGIPLKKAAKKVPEELRWHGRQVAGQNQQGTAGTGLGGTKEAGGGTPGHAPRGNPWPG